MGDTPSWKAVGVSYEGMSPYIFYGFTGVNSEKSLKQ